MGLRPLAIVVTLTFICTTFATGQELPKLTGKERLGRKWTDEQRIDNCHVPADKRGAKKRPSACPNDPTS